MRMARLTTVICKAGFDDMAIPALLSEADCPNSESLHPSVLQQYFFNFSVSISLQSASH